MPVIELAPYFHPTQIVLVDDDIDFLGNLSLQVDADLAYLLFDSTHKALDYLNERQADRLSRNRFFREVRADRQGAGNGVSLEIDLDSLRQEMQAPDRFAQISVALVDYAMPQMDGLEFCRRIRDPHVRKILFTGVATEADAVDAFNQGIIDGYIRKHEHAVYDVLNSTIRQCQHDYMRDAFVAAADLFPLQVPNLLEDPSVAQLMDRLRRSHDTVEYYLADAPAGFWLVSGSGAVQRLVFQTDADAKARAEHSNEIGLDSAQAQQVALNELIFLSISTSEDTVENIVQPSNSMPGNDRLRWAVFDIPERHRLNHVKSSYDEFLEWLDTVGYSLM